jgi:peptidoglycan-associated lipoprotein
MRNFSKAFITGLVLVMVVLVPACRKKVKPKVNPPVDTMSTMPDVPTTVTTQPETQVKEQPDFVQEQKPAEELLPSDIEELNRVVQQRGLVRDAFFNYDEATLDADAQAALSATANWLKNNRNYNLLIEGHCDERGTEQYNLALGDRRANIAREYLMTLGIDSSRIRTVSYGEERPFDEGHDDSAWAKNRRAHLVLVR